MIWLVLVLITLAIFYLYCNRENVIWKRQGIPEYKSLPLLGSMYRSVFKMISLPDLIYEIYSKYPTARYIGMFNFRDPVLLVKDPEAIKQITVKKFDHFLNHQAFPTENSDPLFGKNLVALRDQRWRDMRITMSPAFTGSKMRAMFVLIEECTSQFTNYFENKIKKEGDSSERIILEMKDVYSKLTSDVIASAVFGLKVNSLENPDNEFYEMGKRATYPTFRMKMIMFGYALIPYIMKKLRILLNEAAVAEFFTKLILDTMKIREERGIYRPDIIQTLMELRKGDVSNQEEEQVKDAGFATVVESLNNSDRKKSNKLVLDNEDIVSQAFIFFFAGFETSATALSFITYEIAVNPDVQKRLQDEIDEALEQDDGKMTYNKLHSLKYLDMVISESLRKWPISIFVERLCNKSCQLPGLYNDQTDSTFEIEAGTDLWIPVYALHHDPQYYPDPDRFDPERFSEENKHKIQPFTYLPFGVGPRACIANRFVLMKLKILLVHMLSKFNFLACEKTEIPLKVDLSLFTLGAKAGFWVALEARHRS